MLFPVKVYDGKNRLKKVVSVDTVKELHWKNVDREEVELDDGTIVIQGNKHEAIKRIHTKTFKCVVCGTTKTIPIYVYRPKFCSDPCKKIGAKKLYHDKYTKKIIDRKCDCCGITYPGTAKGTKFCSPECKKNNRASLYRRKI